MRSFGRLWQDHDWLPIRNCPGRFRLAAAPSDLAPADLLGSDRQLAEISVQVCRDPVVIAELDGGGLISYRRASGGFIHTLNTPDGFQRKLAQLGLEERVFQPELPDEPAGG